MTLIEMVDERMRALGATEEASSRMYRWWLETPLGPLRVHPHEDWVAMRLEDVEAGRKKFGDRLGNRFGFNPYSGKYNVQVCANKDPEALFRLFEWKLGLVMNAESMSISKE